MYSITITSADTITVQETNVQLISVAFDITKDGAVVASLRHGYDLETSQEDINADLQNVLASYAQDQEIAAQTAEQEAAQTQAQETIDALVGQTITQ